jgi:hypothetical protein
MQADRDLVVIAGSLGAMLDPSADDRGVTAKLGIDATRPFGREFPQKLVMPLEKMAWARALVDASAAEARVSGSRRAERAGLSKIDVLRCPHCAGRMRLIATIEDPPSRGSLPISGCRGPETGRGPRPQPLRRPLRRHRAARAAPRDHLACALGVGDGGSLRSARLTPR